MTATQDNCFLKELTMTQKTFDFTAMFDTYRQAFAPLIAAQQNGLKTLERLARYQFAVAGDYLDWTLSHAKTSVEPKSVADLVSEQTALNTSFSEKLRARAEEFTQIASETQENATKWFDEASAKVAETAKKAA
jgi:phasin family protein